MFLNEKTSCVLFFCHMLVRTVVEYLKRWGHTPQRPRRLAHLQDPADVMDWLEKTYPAVERRAHRGGAEISGAMQRVPVLTTIPDAVRAGGCGSGDPGVGQPLSREPRRIGTNGGM
ncbi:MAG TPA: winged helix-turn-helix domain-containing protein [Polyangiaceae bacterium]